MKTIDNFDIIKDMITFEKKDNKFFIALIVRRAKDHQDKVNESAIATYYIRSKEDLEKKKDEMIAIANHYGARIYINVSPKSMVQLQNEVAKQLLENITTGQIDNPVHVTKHIAGKLTAGKEQKWVIDIDEGDNIDLVIEWLDDRDIKYKIVPTVSGFHLITSKFDSNAFGIVFAKIHLHKNSMGTLLYFNK